MLQQGRPVVDIAVVYPIHGLQAAYYFGPGEPYTGGVIPKWADYMDVGERLSLEMRHDFTYLHPESLDARCQVANGLLELQLPACPQQYRLVIMPGMEAVSATNLGKIKAYFDQGGHIIATTRLPDQAAELGKNDDVRAMIRHIFGAAASELSAALSVTELAVPDANGAKLAVPPGRIVVNRNAQGGTAWFVADPATVALRRAMEEALPQPDVSWKDPPAVVGGHVSYLHKEIDSRHVWFFTNSSDTPVDTVVDLRGSHALERWDPHTGRIEPCPATTSENRTCVQLQLAPVSSAFLVSR